VCSFANEGNRALVRSKGFTQVSDFGVMRASNFASMAGRISKLRAQAGGFHFGEMHVHNLEALAYWVHDKQCLEIVARDFTIAVHDECRSMVDTEKTEVKHAESLKAPMPAKFEVSNWVAWEIVFTNYLSGLYGVTNVPLNYIIQKETPEGHTYITDTRRLVSTAPLEGRAFWSNTQSVYRMLKGLTVGTDTWEWIKLHDQSQDSHLAFQTLRQHYDGPGEIDSQIALGTKADQRASL
jgi:hypothetical protein